MYLKSLDQGLAFETQAVRLFRILEIEVLSGHLKPGQRMIRRELTKRFEVSQATVTEALWRLESEGLAESAPMFGTRVARISPERVNEEIALREALECSVARLLAEKARTVELSPLYALADQVDIMMREAKNYSRDGMQTHQEFHLQLASLTGSLLLKREVERIWRRHCVFFNWVSAQVHRVPPHWHRILLDAISSGEAETAAQAMRKHVLYGSTHQMKVLQQMQQESETTPAVESGCLD